ncbi:HK97 gp10 family phage protein [Pseudomonas nitroreducens]|uniref:HK97 gp10 family phage protein n=1 Tax=Pseudomonas nitroreducens TaxID=46680 RepID=A0ABS0KNH2_PSENT|nr:HK97 gp10 family phage protein [Pseudomonas nitroreducens]MBG6289529.1 HK97 gp10 family phage protein [Pseudomonas nitroreducens]
MANKYAGAQGSFSAQINSFVEQTKEDLTELFQNVVIAVGTSVIKISPVDTGRFRGEWQFTIDTPAQSQNGRIDPTGNDAIADVVDGALMLQIGQTAWLVNLLPYAIPLEYGHSDQAPNGMVRITIARFQELVRKEAERIKGGR